MVARQAKHLANACLREVADGMPGPVAVHFLNCFLGRVTNPLSPPKEEHRRHRKGKSSAQPVVAVVEEDTRKLLPTLTTATLWQRIHERVQIAYDFTLPADAASRCAKLPMLRHVCKAVGLQLVRRDYDLEAERPFQSDDLNDLIPVAKYNAPQCQEAREMLDSGRLCLVQGLIDLASPLLNDALSIMYQVYGPMHRQTAQCYTHLAILNFNTRHLDDAIALQEKAVVILERTLGMDHPETVAAYEWLAVVLAASGRIEQAAAVFRQGLGLLEILHGPDHLQGALFQLKACQLLQEAHPAAQMTFLERSLAVKRRWLGQGHSQTINCEHAVAMANAQRGMFRLALDGEQKVLAALKEKHGEKDSRTAEAEMWLKEFTKRAVAEGKHQKNILTNAGMSEAESKDIMKLSGEGGVGGGAKKKNRRKKSGAANGNSRGVNGVSATVENSK